MSDMASERFATQALDYDRHRPRYPESVFDDIVASSGLADGDVAVEIGAGTGIATQPLVERGLRVTAIEPSDTLAAMVHTRVADRAEIIVGRFEDFSANSAVRLIAAFNAWHWVEPRIGVDLSARLLTPGGMLALVWTEVVEWGQEPFEQRLAEIFGRPWAKKEDLVRESLQPIRDDDRFDEIEVRHHIFERTLDAQTFVAATRTYGADYSAVQYQAIEQVINHEFGGAVTKVEDAALYLAKRR
jgi:SAM-dependent methyltransferase